MTDSGRGPDLIGRFTFWDRCKLRYSLGCKVDNVDILIGRLLKRLLSDRAQIGTHSCDREPSGPYGCAVDTSPASGDCSSLRC